MRENTKKLVVTALVAALYATLTLALGFISYGQIQFRLSEIMILLAFIRKEYIVGLTLGCFLANVIGPYGVPDIIFGTLATLISAILVYLTSKSIKKGALLIASLWPTIINGIMIGAMLNIFFGVPLVLGMLQVAFGEFVVITIVGIPFFKMVTKKYGSLLENVFK